MIPSIGLTIALIAQLVGDWTGSVQTPVGPWRVNISITQDMALHASVDFPDVNVYERASRITASDSVVRLERPQPGAAPIILTAHIQGGKLVGSFNGLGHEAPMTLERTTRLLPGYREEPVTFADGEVRLAGTLILPGARGRYRAIVCIHGSGPVDRSAYRSKATYLARRGTAVLIYDKRGVGESTGDGQSRVLKILPMMHWLACNCCAITTRSIPRESGSKGSARAGGSRRWPRQCHLRSRL